MKKRVGIVTYVRTDNYGAELQGYALQHKINMMGGFEAEVLDIDHVGMDKKTYREMIVRGILSRLKHNPAKGIADIVSIAFKMFRNKNLTVNANKTLREAAFSEFWDNAITHSKHIDVDRISTETGKYDVLIAGSDQIWNYLRTSNLAVYFLNFSSSKQIKFSYAASFSISKIPTKRKKEYTDLINQLPSISVREQQGAEIIRELTNREVEVVLDPTLLLDKEEWLKIASDRIDIKGPYILTYSLSSSKGYWEIIHGYAQKYGLKVINLRHDFIENRIPPYQIDIFDAGPREFIHLLAKAELVITNSFHGTIFSINFNVPFISVINRLSETNSRILSILENIGLENRLQYDDDTSLIKPLEMDFCEANARLEHLKSKSLEFLKSNLQKNA